MKGKYIISLVFLALVVCTYGQGVAFLNAPSDARSAAMGNTGYVLASPFAVNYNSALIMLESEPSVGVGVSLLLWQPQAVDGTLYNAAVYKKFKKWGIMGGFRSNKYGEITKSDENGTPYDTFVPSELDFSLGIAYAINPSISIGVSLRHVSSKIDEDVKSSSMASDISLLYSRESFRLGLGISNVGSKIDYGNVTYDLPTRIKTGGTYLFRFNKKHDLVTSADVYYQLTTNYSGLAGGWGAEYNFNN